MSEYSLRLAKPHCENCHKPKGMSKEVSTILGVDWGKEPSTSIELSLTDRLQQAINQAKQEPEEDEL